MKKEKNDSQGTLERGRVFYSILRILVVFINIPILIALIFIQGELNRSHTSLQETLGIALESQMAYTQEVNPGRNHSEQLSALQDFEVLRKLGEETTLTNGPDLEEAEEALLSITPESSDNGVVQTYLYFPNSDYLIDSSQPEVNAIHTCDPVIFVGYKKYGGDKPRDYMYIPSSPDESRYTIYTATVFPGVIYIFDIIFYEDSDDTRPDVLLSNEFSSYLEEVETCYYDSFENTHLTSGSGKLIGLYDYYSLEDQEPSFSFTYGGHRYLCHYVQNDYSMTKYVLFCRDEIAEEQQTTTILIWISGALLLITLLICAFFFLRRTYRPFGALMSRASKRISTSSRDEFEVFNQAFDMMDESLNQRDSVLQKYYLLRVLRGQKLNLLEDYQDDWLTDDSSQKFVVAALRVDESVYGTLYDETELDSAIVRFFSSNDLPVRTVSDGDFLYIVLRLPDNMPQKEVLDIFCRLQKSLSQYTVSIFISDPRPAKSLRQCYNEAMTISESYIAKDIYGVVADRASMPQPDQQSNSTTPDFRQLRQLSDCIASLSYDETMQLFDELACQLSLNSEDKNSMADDNPYYSLLASTVALAMYDVNLPGDNSQAMIQQSAGQIKEAQNISELRSKLSECLETLIRCSEKQDYPIQRLEAIKEYIQKNYSNPNLDASTVAVEFDISPSTLTRLFRKYNNSGFLQYVHQTRVRKATELLQTTDLSVAVIAERVGYTNVTTMNRAFKSYAGSTPGAIRHKKP